MKLKIRSYTGKCWKHSRSYEISKEYCKYIIKKIADFAASDAHRKASIRGMEKHGRMCKVVNEIMLISFFENGK